MRDKKCFLPYLLGLLMVISLKLYSDQAGSDELIWILRPTAWWTSTLSGFPFTYQQGVGYINHSLRFIIAPACAGLRFLMIACLMLIWSFVHRIDGRKKQLYWTLLSLPASCAVTIFVNGIRITLSIILPPYLQNPEHLTGRITSGQLHTAIGTQVYFLSLLVLYQAGDKLSEKIGSKKPSNPQKERSPWTKLLPILWYLGPVLGLPILSRIYYKDYKNLTSYELPVLAVCGNLLIFLSLIPLGKKLILRHRTAK